MAKRPAPAAKAKPAAPPKAKPAPKKVSGAAVAKLAGEVLKGKKRPDEEEIKMLAASVLSQVEKKGA